MPLYAILDGHAVVPCDVHAWCGSSECEVASDEIGEVEVSTVFLGLNHAMLGERPLWFETMVYGGPMNQHYERCETWEQAEAMHARICAEVRAREDSR